jgi:pantothenate synthetase
LYRSLQRAEELFRAGERDAAELIAAAKELFAQEPAVRWDYFEIADPDTLEPVMKLLRPALAAVAAFVGSTRLIDNVVLVP